MILPRLKNHTPREGRFVFGKELRFFADSNNAASCAYNLLSEFCKEQEIRLTAAGEADAHIRFVRTEGESEFYTLSVRPDGVTAGYTDCLSARNAAAAFVAMLTVTPVPQSEETARVPVRYAADCCECSDRPDNPYRGFMVDVARRYIPLSELRLRVRELAFARMNVMHVHLLDTERYALKSEAVHALNVNTYFRQYTAEELRDLDEYAKGLGVALIPEIDLPGHGLFILDVCPELKCVKDGEPIGIWDVCVSNPNTYNLIDALIGELKGIFSCEYVHIGGDELCFYDMKDSGYWMHWKECDACRALMEKERIRDDSDFFCYFIRRVHAVCAAHGKKLMMWGDSVDTSRPVDLPRDILVQFWRVASPTRGPHEGCSMQRWLEEGFRVVNSFYEETYIDDYAEEERLAKWNPKTNPAVDPAYFGQIVGGEVCAWGTRDHFTYTLPSGLTLFGDRFWNDAPLPRGDELTAALTRQVVSREEGYPDVFRALGGGLLPLYGRNKFFPSDRVTAEDVDACIARVRRTISGGWCDKFTLTEFIRCLEDAKKHYTEGQPEPEHTGDA